MYSKRERERERVCVCVCAFDERKEGGKAGRETERSERTRKRKSRKQKRWAVWTFSSSRKIHLGPFPFFFMLDLITRFQDQVSHCVCV
jgi:hypothetical protein